LGIAAGVLFCSPVGMPRTATAEDGASDPANFAWQAGALAYAKRMSQRYSDPNSGQQPTPLVIPKFASDLDPSGAIATLQPGGPTQTLQNAFFANLGTNGRTCFSCHQRQNGWTVSAASVQQRFEASKADDPIFRLIDGATCPSADVSSMAAKRKAYSLLLSKGLIRIGLKVPDNAEFRITAVKDPYNCNTNPVTGLTHFGADAPTTGMVSVYRRPLPSTNLGFLTAIMADGREPDLTSQAIDATVIHAQRDRNNPLTDAQLKQIVAFETGIFTAQIFDNNAKGLDTAAAMGGPAKLAALLPSFYAGINDPLGGNKNGLPFTSKIFDLYDAWSGTYASWVSTGHDEDVNAARRAVARGQALFNNTPINITRVAGINDALGVPSLSGFCGTCHDTPDVGNHSVKLPINIGIANGGANNDNPRLDIKDLPVFSVSCVSGPNAGQNYTVTDLGRAMISGTCADIGKVKGPILRGLAGRAPYFHNGSAATLLDVVNFYDDRFNIGFTEKQKRDLVAFLQSL
jgi:hypothetical protein